MSEAGTRAYSQIVLTTTPQKRHGCLIIALGSILGLACGAAMALFMLIAWPHRGTSSSPDATILFPYIYATFGCFGGLVMGGFIASLAAVVSHIAKERSTARLVGAIVGALVGAIVVVVLVTYAKDIFLGSIFLAGGIWHMSLPFQILTGALPGMLCGLLGTIQPTTTSATCATCGGFVRLDATLCKHCGVAFMPVDKPSFWKRNLNWIAASAVLLLGLFSFAAWLGAQSTVAVPEVDTYTLETGKVKGNHSKAELTAVLGEAPLVYSVHGEEWAYPIRVDSWSYERATPAPMLEVTLDKAGLVVDWGFFHPITRERLPIHESLGHANQWFNECNVSQERRIDLATVLKKGTTKKKEALVALVRESHNLPYFYEDPERHFRELAAIFARPSATGEGEILRFYVDHPSPLFIPPYLYIRVFDESGSSPFGYVSGYGC